MACVTHSLNKEKHSDAMPKHFLFSVLEKFLKQMCNLLQVTDLGCQRAYHYN